MPSPSDFMSVRPPGAASYQGPDVDFSWLSNLLPNYYKAQMAQNELAQQRLQLGAMQQYFGQGAGQQAQADQGTSTDQTADTASATGSRADPRGKIPVIVAAAKKYGIDPSTAVRVARSEGLFQFTSGIPGEKSFGAFQLNTQGGMGNDFQRDTGLDPSDPKNEDATIDYALRKAAQGGWGPFHGAANTGIGQWAGITRGDKGRMPVDIEVRTRTPTQAATADASGTSAPAPNEPTSVGGAPPFAAGRAPPRMAAASAPSASGKQNITLASNTPNVGGLMPQPAATVAPTSSAEVAGAQGAGGMPSPVAGPITPQGRDNLAQGPNASGAENRGVAEAIEPESDPRVRGLDRRIQGLMDAASRESRFGVLIPGAKANAENIMRQVGELQKQRQELVERLGRERGMQLETKEQEIRGRQAADIKTYNDEFADVTKKGDDATRTRQTLRLAESLMNDPGFDSGTFAGNKLAYKRFMVALGLGDSNMALTQEGFQKAVSEAILEQLKSLGGLGLGQVKAKEFETMTKAAQNTENTPATNRLLTEMGLRLAERWQIPLAQMALQYRREHGGHLDAGWDEAKARYLENTPLFSEDELRDTRRIAPLYARSPQEARAKGWHDGDPLRVPPPPGSPPGTPDRIITHLRAPERPDVRVAPVQQER